MKKFIAIICSVIFIDQLTKGILLTLVADGWPLYGDAFALVPNPYMMWRITNWFNLVFTWNPGTAFSLFRDLPSFFIIVMTGAVIGYLLHTMLFRAKDNLEKCALAIILGGAFGNIIDRVRFGAVVDFIDWHIGDWHWPAFNMADVAICVGVGLYILYFIRKKG